MNSINGGHLVLISGVYKQHPALPLETKCQPGALSRQHRSGELGRGSATGNLFWPNTLKSL